jgi:hypothetical protein
MVVSFVGFGAGSTSGRFYAIRHGSGNPKGPANVSGR